jgi:O-antigen/teichoic acid export membrane protein
MLYLPALLAASFIRNFALNLLQTKFLIKQIFWVDAVHFLGAPILVWVVSRMREFDTALDLIIITIISLSASSIVGFWLTRSVIVPRRRPESAEIRKLWDYGKYSLGGIASFLFYTKSDSFFLSSFGGPVQVAVYNSVKVFIRVYDMVTQVVQMFVMPAASNLSSRGELSSLKVLVEKAILFSTVGMMPVLFLFLFFSSPLVHLVYTGRYTEAIPLLQVFSLLSLVVPVIAIASNTLMGLGEAKVGFVLSMQMLGASTLAYLVLIPLFGAVGATIGYVLSSFVFAWLNVFQMNRFVPITVREVLGRTRDIEGFLRSRLRR